MYALAAELNSKQPSSLSFTEQVMKALKLTSLENGEINDFNPHALAASANPNILSHAQAKKAMDWDKFVLAMEDEVKRMIDHDIFEEVSIEDIPLHQRILRAVWSHRRKNTPSGEVYRHRSRLCVDSSQQQYGIDFTDTYSPVVSWTTVCILFILSILLDLKSRSVNYVQAFPQATLPEGENVYMALPDGYKSTSKGRTCLKLKKNIYGLKQAAYN